jgi:hypothetical protein
LQQGDDFIVQKVLFPFMEKEFEEPLIEKLRQLVATLELGPGGNYGEKTCFDQFSFILKPLHLRVL